MPDSGAAVVTSRRRVGLSRAVIVDGAVALVDDEGADALTMTALAKRLGVTQPALYAHVESLDSVRRDIAVRGVEELADDIRDAVAGRSGLDALEAMTRAYLGYAQRFPGRYLVLVTPLDDDDYEEAAENAALVVRGVIRSFGIASQHDVLTAHRAFRAWVHGMMHLAAIGSVGDSESQEATLRFFVTMFGDGLARLAAKPEQ